MKPCMPANILVEVSLLNNQPCLYNKLFYRINSYMYLQLQNLYSDMQLHKNKCEKPLHFTFLICCEYTLISFSVTRENKINKYYIMNKRSSNDLDAHLDLNFKDFLIYFLFLYEMEQNEFTLNVWTPIRNMMLKTQSPYHFSLRNYVHFKVFKIEMSKCSPFLHFWSYVKTVIHIKWTELHKEQFGVNQISIYVPIFITEIHLC